MWGPGADRTAQAMTTCTNRRCQKLTTNATRKPIKPGLALGGKPLSTENGLKQHESQELSTSENNAGKRELSQVS